MFLSLTLILSQFTLILKLKKLTLNSTKLEFAMPYSCKTKTRCVRLASS